MLVAARALLEDRPILVIVGPSTGSRNRLASEIARLPDGPAWSRHVARHGEIDRPYLGLRQIFPALHPLAGDDLSLVVEAVRTYLSTYGVHRPLLVMANADRCDPASIEALVRLAVAGDIRLVATLPPESTADHGRLLDRAEIMDLPPLTADVVAGLVRARFGAMPDPSAVELLLDRSDGAYDRVHELADSLFRAGRLVAVEGTLELAAWPAEAGDPAQPAVSGSELADLLDVTAILDVLEVGDARSSFSTQTLDLAVARGDLYVDDGALHPSSPDAARMIRRSLSHLRRADLFERFGTLIPETLTRPGTAVRVADWQLEAGSRLPVELAVRAAREANLTGRHRRAVAFSDPDHVEGGATVALVERFFALVEVGDYATLRSLYTSLDPATLSEEELLPYFRWMDRLKDDVDRSALGRRAVEAADPHLARRRVAVQNLSDLVERSFVEAGEDLASQLRALAFTSYLSPANRAMAFTTLAAALRNSGRPARAVQAADFALSLLTAQGDEVSAFHLETAREYQVLALLSSIQLDRAEVAIAEYSLGPLGRPGSGRLTTGMHGVLDLYRGDSTAALANIELCLAGIRPHDPRNVRGWLQALLAMVLVQRDRPDEAAAMLQASRARRTRRAQWDLEARVARASVLDALAEPEEALEVLDEVFTEAGRRGMLLVQIEAAVMSLAIGGPPHLPALLAVVDDLVDPSGTPALWQQFARAARDYDIGSLVALADDLAGRREALLAAEVAQYVLDIARRADDLDPPTRSRMVELSDPATVRRIS